MSMDRPTTILACRAPLPPGITIEFDFARSLEFIYDALDPERREREWFPAMLRVIDGWHLPNFEINDEIWDTRRQYNLIFIQIAFLRKLWKQLCK
jgi:hypothetical protein